MVLVDSSVWIAHLRAEDPRLSALLRDGLVRTHPWIVGELACGTLRDRARFLASLRQLGYVTSALEDEISAMIERERLWGQGLGFVDVGLLASARLSGARLWTADARLAGAARRLGVELRPSRRRPAH